MATGRETEPHIDHEPSSVMHRAIDEIAQLPANWNGYGAPPIDPATIAAARGLVDLLASSAATLPQVVPMTRGRLQFEWHRGSRSLELELASPSAIRYLKWDSALGISEEDELPIGRIDQLRRLVAWFAAE